LDFGPDQICLMFIQGSDFRETPALSLKALFLSKRGW
jgi:hypothetical protein